MTTNRYFDNLYNSSESDMYSDLTIEAIQMYGIDCLYIVREIENIDELLKEETLSKFRITYDIEAIVQPNGNVDGRQNYMSKFGFRFEEMTEIYISVKRFDELGTGFFRPREGDLIYLGNKNNTYGSFVNNIFHITSVEYGSESGNWQFGGQHTYKLSMTNASHSYNDVAETNYDEINNSLNVNPANEQATTTKTFTDTFATETILPKGNPFGNW